jgi:hypothetical protein
MNAVKTREYYENIGKYDQFAGGWEDFAEYNTQPDTIFMTPLRDDYLTQRYDSNKALKMATSFATIIMFNHLISAFDAIIAAKNYREPDQQLSWSVALITDYRQRNPIRGINFSVAF